MGVRDDWMSFGRTLNYYCTFFSKITVDSNHVFHIQGTPAETIRIP